MMKWPSHRFIGTGAATATCLTLIGFWLARGNSPVAAAMQRPQADRAAAAIQQFLQDESRVVSALEQSLASSRQVIDQWQRPPAAMQVPLSELRSNPFRPSAQLADPQVDAKLQKQREQERRQALNDLQRLTLQSLQYATDRSTCVINNTVLREGQSYEGFIIEQIDPASVTVRNGSYRFELRLQK